MSEADEFASSLLEESKRFLERAQNEEDIVGQKAFLHAALMLGFCALEAHVNSIADDFTMRSDLSISDKSLLLEQEIRLENGNFVLKGSKIFRLEDRILFLHKRFSSKPLDKSAEWWSSFKTAIKIRNALTHPKTVAFTSINDVRKAIQAIVSVIDALYKAVYKKKFPAASRGLNSKLNF